MRRAPTRGRSPRHPWRGGVLAVLVALVLAGAAWGDTTPSAPSAPGPAAPGAAPAAPPAGRWEERGTARLDVLDKVDARTTHVQIRAGASTAVASLTIAVRSCVVRPPDMPADAAAWLDITDSHGGAPPFHGWIFAAEPWIGMYQHPVYSVRLTACQ